MFINFVTNKGQLETIYTQESIKTGRPYFFKLSVQQSSNPVDITVYLNGQVQVQVSLTSGLLTPKGLFFIGSEKASNCFQGLLWDVNLYNRDLTNQEVQ